MAVVTSTLPYKPLYLQAVGGDTAISYGAYDFRVAFGAIWPRTGALGVGMRVYPRLAGANWSVDVDQGYAVLGNTSSGYDRYLVWLEARTNLALTGFVTAPASTRTHRVFIAVYNKAVVGTEYAAKLVVTEDTGSGAPVPADNPAYYMELGTFVIAPSQVSVGSANIVNTIRRADQASAAFDLPLGANIVSATGSTNGGPPRYQLAGNRLRFNGVLARSTGDFAQGTVYTLGTLPEGYRPKYERYCAGVAAAANGWRLTVTTAGVCQASFPSSGASTLGWISLDGCSIEIDG